MVVNFYRQRRTYLNIQKVTSRTCHFSELNSKNIYPPICFPFHKNDIILGQARRSCSTLGAWNKVKGSNKTWADYSGCHFPDKEDIFKQIEQGDVRNTYI